MLTSDIVLLSTVVSPFGAKVLVPLDSKKKFGVMTPIRRLVEHMLSRIKPDLEMEGASHTAVDLGRSAVIEEAARTTPNLKSFMEQKANTI